MDLSTLTLPAPVLARVYVADAELDVLFLIVQYLRDLGLSTTVVALLRESGVDPFWLCGASREIALLREWIFQGEWARVRTLLSPLSDVLGECGLAVALARVDKQVLLEEFHFTSTPTSRRREIVESLQTPTTHSVARLTKEEMYLCLRLLKDDAPGCGAWSLDEARLTCFESLVPLFRDAIEDDDEEMKYLTMPRRQLVSLLNDACLLHEDRSGEGDQDIVAMTPASENAQLAETESGSSSLRLVKPTKESSSIPPEDFVSQSIDLSQYQGKHHRNESKLIRSRNPLIMSMAFPRSRRRHKGQGSYDQETTSGDSQLKHADKRDLRDGAVGYFNNSTTVNDAKTQTDGVTLVDQATETLEAPSHPPTAKTTEENPGEDEVVDDETFDSSNQTVETADTVDDRAIPSLRSSSISHSSKTETVVASAPLEAWCTSRRRELPLDPHTPGETEKSPYEGSTTSEKHSRWEESQLDRDDPTIYDDEDKTEGDGEEWEPAPVRTYSQLTIDSAVRAHVVAEVREAQAIRAMDISPDGSEMVIGTNARALRVFDLTEPLASSSLSSSSGGLSILPLLPVSLERHKHHASSIYTACYNHISPAHAAPLIATGAAESSIKVLSRWTQQELWIRGHSGKSRALCFASPSLLCSAASSDMVIRAWDLGASSTIETPCVQRFDGHVGEILAMAISAYEPTGPMDRQCFVSSSMDRTVRLWDMRSAQCARVLARTASPVFTLAFQPQSTASNLLATGHQDGTIALWDLRTSSAKTTKPLVTVTHHQDECRAVSWSPDGQWLLSASFDGTLCLLDASGHPQDLTAVAAFHQHHDKILQAQWHPIQPAIVTTGADKLVKLWGFS